MAHIRPWPGFLWRQIKRRLPTPLFGRGVLIIVLPVAVMQIAVTWAFFDAHWQTVNSRLTEGLAGDVAWVLQAYEADPSPKGLARLSDRTEQTLGLKLSYREGAQLPRGRRDSLFAAVDRSLGRALDERLDVPFWFDTVRYPAY